MVQAVELDPVVLAAATQEMGLPADRCVQTHAVTYMFLVMCASMCAFTQRPAVVTKWDLRISNNYVQVNITCLVAQIPCHSAHTSLLVACLSCAVHSMHT